MCGGKGNALSHNDYSVTSESKILRVPSELCLCGQCGHIFTTIDLEFDTYYTDQYDAKLTADGMDEIVSTRDGQIVFRTDFDYGLFKEQVVHRISRNAPIFEFGCGRGRILNRLSKDGFRNLFAYDLSESYREPVARVVDADRIFIGLRPENKQFDLTYSFFVLEHDTNPVDSLRYLSSVTKPGGYLYLMLPNFVTNIVDLACSDHVNHFSASYLEFLVAKCGFEVLVRDDSSNIGATCLLAQRDDSIPDVSFDNETMRREAESLMVPYLEYSERLSHLSERLDSSCRLFLYGAGFYSALVSAHLQQAGRSIDGIFDANPRKLGTRHVGNTVLSPDTISQGDYGNACLIICLNPKIAESVGDEFISNFQEIVLI